MDKVLCVVLSHKGKCFICCFERVLNEEQGMLMIALGVFMFLRSRLSGDKRNMMKISLSHSKLCSSVIFGHRLILEFSGGLMILTIENVYESGRWNGIVGHTWIISRMNRCSLWYMKLGIFVICKWNGESTDETVNKLSLFIWLLMRFAGSVSDCSRFD